MKRWMWLVLPAILIMFAACASGHAIQAGPADLNELSGEQIANFSNAFLAVQTMRPKWLSSGVFRDGVEVGGVAELQYMSTEGIAYIHYYNGIEASARWGLLAHARGVIYVASTTGLTPGRDKQ